MLREEVHRGRDWLFLEGGVEGTGKDIRGTLSRAMRDAWRRTGLERARTRAWGRLMCSICLCIHSAEIYSESLKCQVLYLVLKMWQ